MTLASMFNLRAPEAVHKLSLGSLIALLFAFLVVGFVKIPGKQNRDGSLFWVEVTGLGVLIFQP